MRRSRPEIVAIARSVLTASRWEADMAVTNYEGERVWLKSYYNQLGERIGITDCCLVESPCGRHDRPEPEVVA
jgi:hypothetical protein